MKSLGLPYTRLETVVAGRDDPNANVKRSYGRSFVVRVPRARHAEVVAVLHAAVGMETESADPKVGAVGVPYRATYVVRPSALSMSDDEVVIDMRGVTTRPRLELREGALVSADLDAQGRLHVPADEVTRVEVTSSLRIDPDGTIILADQRPEGQASRRDHVRHGGAGGPAEPHRRGHVRATARRDLSPSTYRHADGDPPASARERDHLAASLRAFQVTNRVDPARSV